MWGTVIRKAESLEKVASTNSQPNLVFKGTVTKIKRLATDWERIFAEHISEKKIYK